MISSKKTPFFFTFCTILLLISFLSCSSKHPEQAQEQIRVEIIEPIEDISKKLLYPIASNYYHHEKNPVVHISLQTKSTDGSVDSAFVSFIYNSLLKKFSKAGQICVEKKPDAPKDCSVILDISKDAAEKITVKATINKTDNTPLLEESYSYQENSFNLNEFEHFKIKYADVIVKRKKKADLARKHGNTRLNVFGHAMGKISEVRENRCYFVEISSESDHAFIGSRSSYFPTGIVCRINGEEYEQKGDTTVFNGYIIPGRIEFTALFNEGHWNASECSEYIGGSHQRTFYVDIGMDDNIQIDIGYKYDGKKASIIVRALKEITVVKNGKKIKKFKEIKVN